MAAHESLPLALDAELVSELNTWDFISKTETGEIFTWLIPLFISGLVTSCAIRPDGHELVLSIVGQYDKGYPVCRLFLL
jgi:hypothetical protein